MESRSTGACPAQRLGIERPFLSPLPAHRFDTDYIEVRRVHNILPFVSVGGVRYSVPPKTLGQLVEVRRAVGGAARRGPHRRSPTRRRRVGPRPPPGGRGRSPRPAAPAAAEPPTCMWGPVGVAERP